jgi:hypothetical protein
MEKQESSTDLSDYISDECSPKGRYLPCSQISIIYLKKGYLSCHLGRPRKPFDDLTDRGKRARRQQLHDKLIENDFNSCTTPENAAFVLDERMSNGDDQHRVSENVQRAIESIPEELEVRKKLIHIAAGGLSPSYAASLLHVDANAIHLAQRCSLTDPEPRHAHNALTESEILQIKSFWRDHCLPALPSQRGTVQKTRYDTKSRIPKLIQCISNAEMHELYKKKLGLAAHGMTVFVDHRYVSICLSVSLVLSLSPSLTI